MIKAQLADEMAQDIVRMLKELFAEARKYTGPDEYGLKMRIQKIILKWLEEADKK